jgi:hypothetical protein
MADLDFQSMIYYHPTPAEQEAKAIADSRAAQHDLLYRDLVAQDFSGAAGLLTANGPCEWQSIAPNDEQFISSYKFEAGKTSLTISERKAVGGNGFFNHEVNQYIPRLTVTADSCPEK